MESYFARCFASLCFLLRGDSCHYRREYISYVKRMPIRNKATGRFKQWTGYFLAKEKTLRKVGAFFLCINYNLATGQLT